MAPAPSALTILLFFFFFFFFFLSSIAISSSLALVPDNQTFVYANNGEFGIFINEYDADYRVLPLGTSPFQLAFFNNSPDTFYFAIRMGTSRSESVRRWVWEANRGRPFRDNGTLTFGKDGNLVLANPDGSVVWSTGTANKGVVGIDVTAQGNLVLFDAKGRFVWQSFDHPTDTLMVGAALRVGGPTKLVSRRSTSDGSFGIYSLVLESKSLNLYINNLIYGKLSASQKITEAKFTSSPDISNATSYELSLVTNTGSFTLASPKYDSRLSFLRLDIDGNLRVYTYDDNVDSQAWETTFALFSDKSARQSACELPSKCGSFGVCQNEMCVACPSPKGLLGWSKGCAPPKLGKCDGGGAVGYYEVAGVENFVSVYNKGEGVVKVEECKRRCSADCKCAGFLYQEETSKCWLAPVLGTLNSVPKSSHTAYVKFFTN